MQTIYTQSYSSPVGELLLGSLEDKLCLCDWNICERRAYIDKRLQYILNAKYKNGTSDVILAAIAQLDEYFASKRKIFDIPLIIKGTDFQKLVWSELLKIPYGTTISYSELSMNINNSKAVRAVASANRANPISIFIPCHRVIGKNNKLVGYAGGLNAKRFLLGIEGISTYKFLTIRQ